MDLSSECSTAAENNANSLSQSSTSSNQDDKFVTPKKFVHRRVDSLLAECKSPALKIPASPMMERLGYGTGVGVYLMERSPRTTGEIRSPWAVKKIAKLRETQEKRKMYVDRLEHEAQILKQLNHPNIIGYRAFGKPSIDLAYLAMEKASASLADLIEARFDEFIVNGGEAPNPFPAPNILKVAEEVAKALVYLHDDMKLIHGDLKSANVLIFGDFEAIKLCDFGVSRRIKDDGTLHGEYVGTEIWSPLEVVRKQNGLPHEPITQKVDIYPYGLTIYEMISLKPPHLPTADDACDDTLDEQAFDEILAECMGTRPLLPDIEFDSTYHKILALFFCCSEESPSQRPEAREILKIFTEDDEMPSKLSSKLDFEQEI